MREDTFNKIIMELRDNSSVKLAIYGLFTSEEKERVINAWKANTSVRELRFCEISSE